MVQSRHIVLSKVLYTYLQVRRSAEAATSLVPIFSKSFIPNAFLK
jgi:hypothetical protein